jgi:hypothetical protein
MPWGLPVVAFHGGSMVVHSLCTPWRSKPHSDVSRGVHGVYQSLDCGLELTKCSAGVWCHVVPLVAPRVPVFWIILSSCSLRGP